MEFKPHLPLCDQCEGGHQLTVKHIFIDCSFLKIIRWRYYDVTDLNQLFKIVSSLEIPDFVKDIVFMIIYYRHVNFIAAYNT